MTRRERLMILIIAGAIGIIVLLQVNKPEPLSWMQRFDRRKTQPYDVSVLVQYLRDVRQQEVHIVDSSFYEQRSLLHDPTSASWVTVTHTLQMDSLSQNALLTYVRTGGTAFIAANDLGDELADSLGIGTDASSSLPTITVLDDAKAIPYSRIEWYDTASCTVVATAKDSSVICIRQQVGRGTLVYCSAPLYLSNYALLQQELHGPPWDIVHALPRGRLTVDEQYVPYHEKRIGLLTSVMDDPALRWAYWLCLLAAVLGVVVYGKRRQRAIPVIEPLKNASKEFALTVSSLYFNTRNNADLVRKMERLYVDHCRTHRGIDPELKQTITSTFDALREQRSVSDAELVALSQHMTTLFAAGRT